VGDQGCEYRTGGKVVILGRTGRNFAAGMSGGIAYVYDGDGTFASRVNLEMVSLGSLDGEDRRFVHEQVTSHHEETGSTVASWLLDNWGREVKRFVRVMPNDYRRVLEAMQEAERTGEPVLDAIMAAAHG